MNSIKSTLAHAAAASYALVSINVSFSCLEGNGILGTPACAGMTTAAKLRIYHRLAVAMLLHLSCPGTAAHAQILYRSTKARSLMSLKMVQRDNNVRIHNGSSDAGIFHIVCPCKRHHRLIRAFESVCNDHRAAAGIQVKAVLCRRFHMFQCIFTPAHIQCVAVC